MRGLRQRGQRTGGTEVWRTTSPRQASQTAWPQRVPVVVASRQTLHSSAPPSSVTQRASRTRPLTSSSSARAAACWRRGRTAAASLPGKRTRRAAAICMVPTAVMSRMAAVRSLPVEGETQPPTTSGRQSRKAIVEAMHRTALSRPLDCSSGMPAETTTTASQGQSGSPSSSGASGTSTMASRQTMAVRVSRRQRRRSPASVEASHRQARHDRRSIPRLDLDPERRITCPASGRGRRGG